MTRTIEPVLQGSRPRAATSAGAKIATTELDNMFNRHSFVQHFQPNSTIVLHGDQASMIYRVESGTVRCCTIGTDGSHQIFSFSNKADFIGISDIEHWHFTAEAVDCVTVRALPRDVVERELKVNAQLRYEFRLKLVQLLQRREEQLLTMITKKAPERLFRFLCDFASARHHADGAAIALPMCRRDIADHLGLSVETVSRAFSELKRSGQIELITCEKFRIPTPPDAKSLLMVG